ncbi:hypothetical protein SOP85_03310 [Pseudomonas sp. YuFO20]|uniref:hypothetical protein n=1 Tax=Pseudomonas TaxID=286 RepID=UPI002364531B|nr:MULTISPECIES: hypothetical protein [Pseudomonas]MDD2102174.1 hypothetical protein [Pseudomonas putida]MEB2514468.1 hypothetical protein [Pseudomonas sp. YuFO20]
MKYSAPLVMLLGSAGLLGCASSSSHPVTLPLTATQQNTGQIGSTTLTTVDNETSFDFYISGVPDGTTLPLRLYTFVNKGSCQQPGPAAYDMNNRITTQRAAEAGWTFYRTAPVAVPELLSGKYSIVVRTTPEDGSVDIFCGDIAQAVR